MADRQQFLPALFADHRIADVEGLERLENNLRNNQPGVLLVVGRHHMPRRTLCTRRAQARLIDLHVLRPELPLFYVGHTEFPVFFGLVDPIEKALSLFFLGKMQEEFDDPGAVAVEMGLQIDDGLIPLPPDGLFFE